MLYNIFRRVVYSTNFVLKESIALHINNVLIVGYFKKQKESHQ